MEALHCNTGGRIEDFDPHVSNLGYWNCLFCCICPNVYMFVEQGMMMDTSIGSFTIPPASLSSFDVISVIFWVPYMIG
jgi:hypothetical protein